MANTENVKIHSPQVYTNCQNFISPVDKIGKEDISQQMAGKNMFLNDISGGSSVSHSGPTETPGHEPQLKAFCTPTQSPFLGLKESSNSLFSNQNPWNLQQNIYPRKPEETEVKNERLFGENQSLLRGVPHLQDGIHHLETDLKEDAKTDLLSSPKGSENEHIKQELKNVAEGVAASVLQSSIPYLDDYWKGEVSHNGEMKQQFSLHTSRIDEIVSQDIRNQLLERLNLNDSGSDSLDHLQIIMDSDLEELRELGPGTVYHGKWRGTDVAIKRINDRCFAGKPSEQERMIDDFWNEAQNLASLHHPNVVAFYGVVLDSPGGSVATVTEYMVKGSLRNALQNNVSNLDRRKRLLIAMDIAFGVEYLHGKNIVHFDLKSDNLLVNLRDPNRPICKVDVFSFGILLWELFTSEEPYADLHYGAIIGGIVSNTLRPPIPDLCVCGTIREAKLH